MEIPERIGRYRIDRELGRGGMGVVYAAFDEQLQRPVAIKTIAEQTPDEQARRRFLREARTAARFRHPNVCHIYEISEHGDELRAGILSELGRIDEALREYRRIEQARLTAFFRDLVCMHRALHEGRREESLQAAGHLLPGNSADSGLKNESQLEFSGLSFPLSLLCKEMSRN